MSQLSQQTTPASTSTSCAHCDLAITAPFLNQEGQEFCCRGCLSVFEILKENNLQGFYSIQNQESRPKKAVNKIEAKTYAYLNHLDFISEYTSKNSNQEYSMLFYLEGIHCLACLWLIEKLPSFSSEIKSARLNFESSLVKVTLRGGSQNFSTAASTLNSLGYTPTPIKSDDQVKELQKKEERGYLLKMGIAAACMMNIMLYAIGIYAGATGDIETSFSWITLAFSLPVVFYSATPFYQSSIASLRNGSINIDTPLSLAIIVGFSISAYNVFQSSSVHYFDSIATLTFLILFSRYLLMKASRHTYTKKDLKNFLTESSFLRINHLANAELEEVHISQLTCGDTILIEPGSGIPCDGIITKGESDISMAILNGESKPKKHLLNDFVFMGTVNLGSMLEVKVQALGEDSRLGQIYIKAEDAEKDKSKVTLLSDKISKAFVAIVLISSLLLAIFFFVQGAPEIGLNRALALIIVTCPCALGLATPLTYSRLINLSAKMGALVKSEYVLEKLSSVENIFFDKTGTLTTGDYRVIEREVLCSPKIPFSHEEIVFSMEASSSHPVALSLIDWCRESESIIKRVPFASSTEVLGKGVEAQISDISYEIKSVPTHEDFLLIVLIEDGLPLIRFHLKDQVKKSASNVVNELKKRNYTIFMASGDQQEQVEEVAKILKIDSKNWKSRMSPEEKGAWVQDFNQTLFIGDGVNDTLAFSHASTSIAVKGSLEVGMNSSEVYLKNSDIELVTPLLSMAKAGTKTIKRNLSFSLIYNIAGAALAINGSIGPLQAAILMPLSSLTVLGSSLWGTRASLFNPKRKNKEYS